MKGVAILLGAGGVALASANWMADPSDHALMFAFCWWAVSFVSWGALALGHLVWAVRILVWGSWAVTAVSPTVYGDLWLSSLLRFALQILLTGLFLGRRETYAIAFACGLSALCLLARNSTEDLNPSFSHWPHLYVIGGLLLLVLGLRIWWGEVKVVDRDESGTSDKLVEHPGRVGLIHLIEDILKDAAEVKKYVLLQVNLDRFRHVNLANGIEVGDRVLDVYTRRLEDIKPPGGSVWRLEGDEFVLVWPIEKDTEGEIHALVSSVQALINRPVEIERQYGTAISLSASLGLTLFPSSPQETALQVLLRAGTALDAIRETGGGGVKIFDQALGQRMIKRFQVESSLRRAIREGELSVYLQSQVNAQGTVVGAECLVRWQHPQQGMIFPGEFLPIAEESDLIVEIGEWVIERACELQVEMQKAGLPQRLAINISPRQFFKSNFTAHLENTVRRTGADARKLVLEITEGLVIRDTEDVIGKMHYLIQKGFSFSLDDFGTGYSSLSHLKNLPVQELKIARNFIQDAPTSLGDAALVKAMCSIASHLNMQVVAEGVETTSHAAFVADQGDVISQGFLYSLPQPAEDWIEGQLVLDAMKRTLSELEPRLVSA